jgi:hypothetical protein
MLRCCRYVSDDIHLNLLDSNKLIDFNNLKTYIESYGPAYHQNVKDPNSKEYHYHCCDSSIFINELPEEAIIKIVSPRDSSLKCMKSKIEDILNRI